MFSVLSHLAAQPQPFFLNSQRLLFQCISPVSIKRCSLVHRKQAQLLQRKSPSVLHSHLGYYSHRKKMGWPGRTKLLPIVFVLIQKKKLCYRLLHLITFNLAAFLSRKLTDLNYANVLL